MVRFLVTTLSLFVVAMAVAAGGVIYIFHHFGRDLPDYTQLADYEPPVMTRIHAGDGRLLAEYAVEKRIFVPIKAIPKPVIDTFLAAEDKKFYSHPGIDPMSVLRAIVVNIKNIGSSRRKVGASTITQQVAKNFLLTNEVSYTRKIKEAILSLRIERAFTKDRILELYLNEIYLGYGSYGVAAAAMNYFNKPLDALEFEEMAYLASLPKAPNNYHPVKRYKAAMTRRNWTIGRMQTEGVITSIEAKEAIAKPLVVLKRDETEYVTADYFAEEVRREIVDRYGENTLYKGGLSVRTTLDPRLQKAATKTLRDGLTAYDRRHGWRGAFHTLDELVVLETPEDWKKAIASVTRPKGLGDWMLAVVTQVGKEAAAIGTEEGNAGRIPLAELRWAREALKDQKRGKKIRTPSNVLKRGDIIAVQPQLKNSKDKPYPEGTYGLRQIPAVNGGIIALDPHTGRVLAMSRGFSYDINQFNRATQAKRQPGSAFKPFVYLAAMDNGYTPATLILDAPFVIDQGPGLPKWRPANYTKKFYGPSTMRLGIEKSRNLMTVRLAQAIGMDKVAEFGKKFGIYDNLTETLSMSLGAGETTLIRMTRAYAMVVNGGREVTPTLIDRIQDRHGLTIFRHDDRNCEDCKADFWTNQPVPVPPDTRREVTSPGTAYQVTSMLKGVVERGTGRRIRAVGKPLAGKTGTTNQERDTWFMGFAPDLAVGVFVGFDTPIPLGKRETGSSVAAPVFRDFMAEALKDKPAIPFRIPPGIRLVRINGSTGDLARPEDKNVIREAFKPGTVPTGRAQLIQGQSWTASTSEGAPATGTGGLY